MNSRERVTTAINHREPDRIPIDLGGSVVTGIHASALNALRRDLGLENRPVKVFEPMMMLGLVETDVIQLLHTDVVGLNAPGTLLGYQNQDWKPWVLPDGTIVEMGGGFTYSNDREGNIFAYPKGNQKVRPSAKMPAQGFYFDNIIRQENLTGHSFNARIDYDDQYTVFSDEECQSYERVSKKLFDSTELALFGNFFLGGVGDIFHIPGPWVEKPRGIRDLQDWIMAHYDHPTYVKDFFAMQTEITLRNLELYRQAVGDRLSVIAISGTDFGSQNGPFISPDCYREFYKPCHVQFNNWVHKNTGWKVFFHSCGSVVDFLDDFIDAGVDIINPVQFSAHGMDLRSLKNTYGSRLVFWGGGTDPQSTLPFGTPEDVEQEVKKNISILAPGGGFVLSAVHNIQGTTPVKNILTMFQAAQKYGHYPILQ
ncbi:MAG: methyltransferase [Candidatus Atribacteria bacterium]|nr:methyltransferase [Candidatus Atribacteria bacterium]